MNAAAWLPPQDVRKILGEDDGDRFISHFSRAPDYVFSLIEKYQINVTRPKPEHFMRRMGQLDLLI